MIRTDDPPYGCATELRHIPNSVAKIDNVI